MFNCPPPAHQSLYPEHVEGVATVGTYNFFLWRDDGSIVERRLPSCLAPFLESLKTELPHEGASMMLSTDEQGPAPFPPNFGETIADLSKDDKGSVSQPFPPEADPPSAGKTFVVDDSQPVQRRWLECPPPARRNGHKPFDGHLQLFPWRDDTGRVERRSSTCLAPFLESLSVELPHEGATKRLSKDD